MRCLAGFRWCAPLLLAACGDGGAEPDAMSTAGAGDLGTTATNTVSASSSSSSASTTGSVGSVGGASGTLSASASSSGGTLVGAGGMSATSSAGGSFSDTTTSAGGTATSGSTGTAGMGGGGSTSMSSAGGMGGAGGGADATGGTGGSSTNECPYSGNIRYQLNGEESWPADVVELLTAAMDEALYYYNCYADLTHDLTVNYDEGVPTAQANVDGWMSFGSNRGYMVVATAMHEVAHTLGVGYSPWTELMLDGRWTGPAVVDFMSNLPAEERDPDEYSQRDYITGDSQHFWPYGLNQASEHQSEWSLVNHVRIVAAMQLDKQAYLNGEL